MVRDMKMSRWRQEKFAFAPNIHNAAPRACKKFFACACLAALMVNGITAAYASPEDYQDGRYLAVSFSQSARELKRIAAEASVQNVALLFVGTAKDENVVQFAQRVGAVLPTESVPTVLIAPDIISHFGIVSAPAYFELREGKTEAVICGSSSLSYLKREYASLGQRARLFDDTEGFRETCAKIPSAVIGPVLPFAESDAIEDAKQKTAAWIDSGKASEAARLASSKPLMRTIAPTIAHLGKASEYSKKRVSPVIRLTSNMRSDILSAINAADKINASLSDEKKFLYGAGSGNKEFEHLYRGVPLADLIAPMTRYIIFDPGDECQLLAAKNIASDGRFYATALLANYSENLGTLDTIGNYLGIETFPLPASVARNLGIDSTLSVVTARSSFFEIETVPITQCSEQPDVITSKTENIYETSLD